MRTTNRGTLFLGAGLVGMGVWLIWPNPAAESTDAATTAEITPLAEVVDGTDPASSTPATRTATPSPEEPEAGRSARPVDEFTAGLGDLVAETLPTDAPAPEATDCDSEYEGMGVEMRAWGDVMLPYTLAYPTTAPGELWDCTPNTAFGAAIALAHLVYLEALRPDLIPEMAIDHQGRSNRIQGHPGGDPTGSIGFACVPIGWNWDGVDTWSLYHGCDDRDPMVSYYRLTWEQERWQLIYPESGQINAVEPPPGYSFYRYASEAG